jgi:hypothetical protein
MDILWPFMEHWLIHNPNNKQLSVYRTVFFFLVRVMDINFSVWNKNVILLHEVRL